MCARYAVPSTLYTLPILLGRVCEPLNTDICELAVRPRLDADVERVRRDFSGEALDGHEVGLMPLEFLDPDGNFGRRIKGLTEPDVRVAVGRVGSTGRVGVHHAALEMHVTW